MYPEQGDIIKVEGIPHKLLVVSKTYFNKTGSVITCYLSDDEIETALHVPVGFEESVKTVYCEQVRYIDIKARGYKKLASVKLSEIVEIISVLQSIFDYI